MTARLMLVALLIAAACFGSFEPCEPVIGPGCRYQVTLHDTTSSEKVVVTLRSQLYNPCLPKEESDKRYPGWDVVPDTIKACPVRTDGGLS